VWTFLCGDDGLHRPAMRVCLSRGGRKMRRTVTKNTCSPFSFAMKERAAKAYTTVGASTRDKTTPSVPLCGGGAFVVLYSFLLFRL
jgi:hypothetical protein